MEQVAIDALVMESAWLREENVALRINAVYLFPIRPGEDVDALQLLESRPGEVLTPSKVESHDLHPRKWKSGVRTSTLRLVF